MFKNNLIGLSDREKKIFDEVCNHLNGCLRKRNIKDLYGYEEEILIDLWMSLFPYKKDEDGNHVMRTVRKESWETVDGEYKKVLKEKQVKEKDYTEYGTFTTHGTFIGICKWRGEQLLINKCKYLFGDKRRAVLDENGKKKVRKFKDCWGNDRKRVVYEESYDESKVLKRDFKSQMRECDLTPKGNDDNDVVTLESVVGASDGHFDESILVSDLGNVCDELEMKMINKLLDGNSIWRARKELKEEGLNFSPKKLERLKAKISTYFKSVEVL